MSTRATYQFNLRYHTSKLVTIYVHHDGYEDGAAMYFYAMIKAGDVSPESFIRANDRAEITESHSAHGDTEYQYDIIRSSEGGAPLLIVRGRRCGEKWVSRAKEPLADFINRHRRLIDESDKDTSQPLVVAMGSTIETTEGAFKRASDCFNDACRDFAMGWIGNANGRLNDATRILGALPPGYSGAASLLVSVNNLNARLTEAFAKQ